MKITPSDFSSPSASTMPGIYHLKYSSDKSSSHDHLLYNIAVVLSPPNNSWCGVEYHDGEVQDSFTRGGEELKISVSPEKVIVNQGNDECRDLPYNEIFYETMSERISERCAKPCRYPNYWLCNYMAKLEKYPICRNEAELRCYTDLQNEIESNMTQQPKKPCIKVQYKAQIGYRWPYAESNEADVFIRFPSPPKVFVKHEYLVYDLVSMISAVGGTMGLFIGFSFRECSSVILRLVGKIVNKLISKDSKKNETQTWENTLTKNAKPPLGPSS